MFKIMTTILDCVDNIHKILDDNHEQIVDNIIPEIDVNIAKIWDLHEEIEDNLLNEIKKIHTENKQADEKRNQDHEDIIKQYEMKYQYERKLREKSNIIWKGKILTRQITNDRFYQCALNNISALNAIPNQTIIEKVNKLGIKFKNINSIDEHISAKLAYAVLCDLINVPKFSHKICMQYISDNNMMHPKYKPLSCIMHELNTFKNTVSSLSPDEQKEYNVEPTTISEMIQFFKETEK